MADAPRLVTAVLAAGSSRRFGDADKLAAQFRDQPLGLHAVRAIPREAFIKAWVITQTPDHPCAKGWGKAGFEIAVNAKAQQGMGSSVALAAELAQKADADALLLALADMPLVPASHYLAMLAAARSAGRAALICSSDGKRRTPPALFGTAYFGALGVLSGDVGGRGLLDQATTVLCPPLWLTDIDTPEMLAAIA